MKIVICVPSGHVQIIFTLADVTKKQNRISDPMLACINITGEIPRVAELRNFCKLDDSGGILVQVTISPLTLSAREYYLRSFLTAALAQISRWAIINQEEVLQYKSKSMM